MSKRSEIIDGREAATAIYGLIYTEMLGWIDLGHAQGEDTKELLRKIEAGELSDNDYYDITYSQGMMKKSINMRMGKFIKWRIQRGRSPEEQQSIALAMMVAVARKFEGLQASFPISLITDSGFSGEDLVSDLLGFYRVVTAQNIFNLIRPVSKEEALKRWDYYGKIGSWKNEDFRPLLFPDPEILPAAAPRKGVLPNFMQTVEPWNDFSSGKVRIATADGSYIDKVKGGVLPYA